MRTHLAHDSTAGCYDYLVQTLVSFNTTTLLGYIEYVCDKVNCSRLTLQYVCVATLSLGLRNEPGRRLPTELRELSSEDI